MLESLIHVNLIEFEDRPVFEVCLMKKSMVPLLLGVTENENCWLRQKRFKCFPPDRYTVAFSVQVPLMVIEVEFAV